MPKGNVPPLPRMESEKWLWQKKRIRIRGADPHKLRLSMPYYISRAEIDRLLDVFDEFKKKKGVG